MHEARAIILKAKKYKIALSIKILFNIFAEKDDQFRYGLCVDKATFSSHNLKALNIAK